MKKHILVSLLGLAVISTACKKEGCTDPMATNYSSEADKDDGSCTYNSTSSTKSISLNLSGLSDLGPDYVYETWIIVNNSPISLGSFTIDGSGNLSKSIFTGNASDIDSASDFVLSIEPAIDPDPAPSSVKVLGGSFNGNSANIVVDHMAALGTDFSMASGEYILAAPTSSDMTDGLSGVWFFNPGAATPELQLPTLPDGWQYEGWAVINGTPVSTGKFTDPAAADDSDMFSGMDAAGPPFPGEDFIQNAPNGLTFPTNLSSQPIVISVEPMPDNSAAPFDLKPLVGTPPGGASEMTPYSFMNQSSGNNPTGTVTR